MGYYTRYTISTINKDVVFEEIKKMVLDVVDTKYGYGDPFDDECKWYDHDKHMLEVSTNHPDIVFVLKGNGEEQGDSWFKYYKNGKVQVCEAKITYDAFDESKLV